MRICVTIPSLSRPDICVKSVKRLYEKIKK